MKAQASTSSPVLDQYRMVIPGADGGRLHALRFGGNGDRDEYVAAIRVQPQAGLLAPYGPVPGEDAGEAAVSWHVDDILVAASVEGRVRHGVEQVEAAEAGQPQADRADEQQRRQA